MSYLADGQVGVHSTAHSPAGLWQFDGNLNDSSGNARDLSLLSGTARYGRIRGRRCFLFDGATELQRVATAALNSLGDMTIEVVVAPAFNTSLVGLVFNGGGDETEANNITYSLRLSANAGLAYLSESGAGVNQAYTVNDGVTYGEPTHVAMVRSGTGTVVTFYTNGKLAGVASGTLTAPTGGTTSPLYVGSLISSYWYIGAMLSLKIIVGTALTATQVAAEAKLCLPWT